MGFLKWQAEIGVVVNGRHIYPLRQRRRDFGTSRRSGGNLDEAGIGLSGIAQTTRAFLFFSNKYL